MENKPNMVKISNEFEPFASNEMLEEFAQEIRSGEKLNPIIVYALLKQAALANVFRKKNEELVNIINNIDLIISNHKN